MSKADFFETLFDYSFKRFVVVRIVRFLYRATVVLAALLLVGLLCAGVIGWVGAQSDIDALVAADADMSLISAATNRRSWSIVPVVLALPLSAILVLGGRLLAEVTIVLFKIAEALTSPSAEPSPLPHTPPDP